LRSSSSGSRGSCPEHRSTPLRGCDELADADPHDVVVLMTGYLITFVGFNR
jgi:hypothetical protein